MTCGTRETGLTCAFKLDIVFLGDFKNMLSVFSSDFLASAVPLDEGEAYLRGECESSAADKGDEGLECFEHGDD